MSPTGTLEFHCDDDLDVGLQPWSFASYRDHDNLTLGLAFQSEPGHSAFHWHEYVSLIKNNDQIIQPLSASLCPPFWLVQSMPGHLGL